MLSGISPESKRDLLLSVGSHRDDRPLSPEEVARAFQEAIDAGSSLNDIAVLVHFDGTSMVTRFIRLLKLPSDVLRIVGWGQSKRTITFTAASEISRLKHGTDQIVLAVAALSSDLTSSEVKAIVQMKQRSNEDIKVCIETIEQLRGSITRRHVIMGEVVDNDVRELLSKYSQNQRDEVLASAMNTLLPSGHDVGGKLSPERFTLTTERDEMARIISGLDGGMEHGVTAAIAKSSGRTEAR
jgi:hypothetical protein